jgi:flavin reductase (DIM6/NTAB) family NADH-FMN oxidoreductase RutF
MKKNLGPVVGLYPTPVVIAGTVIDNKVNWINIAHIGIIGLDSIMLSMGKSHYSNQGIKENKTVSVNLINEEMLVEADYVGMVSGKTIDKSEVFDYYMGELKNSPIIKNSSLVMECEVVDNYETKTHDHFILKVAHTHADENVLNENGKIDYEKVRPILFEMPTRTYLKTGDKVADCWSIGKEYRK